MGAAGGAGREGATGTFEKQQQPFVDQERHGQSWVSQAPSRIAWPGDGRESSASSVRH